MAKQVSLDECAGYSGNDFQAAKLKQKLKENIVITDYRIEKGKFGEYVMLELGDGTWYRTSSKVVRDQVKSIKKTLDKGKEVKARLIKEKNYFTLIPPK